MLFFNIFFFDKHDLHVSEFSDQLLTTVYCAVAALHRVRGGALPYAARVARLWAAATALCGTGGAAVGSSDSPCTAAASRASSLTMISFVKYHPKNYGISS